MAIVKETESIKIFTTLSTEITNLTSSFTTEVMQNIITNITPVVIISLTVYFAFYAILILNQKIDQPINSFLFEFFKVGIITSIALTSGFYQQTIADIIINLPDDFAKSAFKNSDDTLSVADSLITLGLNKASEMFDSSSILEGSDGIAKIWIAFVIASSTVTLGAIGGGLLLLVKISCTLLAAIGPLFIVALLFKQTRQLFSNWLSEIIGYCVFSLMITIVFVFILKISEKYLSAIQDDDNKLIATFVFVILVLISLMLFFYCHKIAQKLSGVASGIGSNMASMGSNFLQAAVTKGTLPSSNQGMMQNASSRQQNTNKAKSWRKR